MSGWYRAGTVAEIPAGATQQVDATCPDGQVVTRGGYTLNPNVTVQASYAVDSHMWRLVVRNGNGAPSNLLLQAICVDGTE